MICHNILGSVCVGRHRRITRAPLPLFNTWHSLMKTDKDIYRERRQRMLGHLGGKCARCGATEDLHIDHIDPSTKEFNVKERLSWDAVKEELRKCQALCGACHRDKTAQEQRNKGFTHGTVYGFQKRKCPCEACQQSKVVWNEERNARRRRQRNPGVD